MIRQNIILDRSTSSPALATSVMGKEASQKQKKKPKKFALIGTGFIFSKHIAAIHNIGGEVVDMANEFFGENYWREMIKNTKANYIVILTPNDLHYEMAKEAADLGKIVLCEKPIALKYSQAKTLAEYPNIFGVLQLKYHPLVRKIKEQIEQEDYFNIFMDICLHRDRYYFKSWKGDKKRSGGILFNLGIHYFHLLEYLFGKPTGKPISTGNDKLVVGMIKGKNYCCKFRLEANEKIREPRRVFIINGRTYNFSSQENLANENLHDYVYEDLIKGKGVKGRELAESVKFIEDL